MYQQHFGLTQVPLGKGASNLFDDGQIAQFKNQFQWLLDSPGIGLLTGEPGVGKTAIMRFLTQNLNPHRYLVIYTPETDFGRFDLYRNLALMLGLEPAHRRAQLWRDIKTRLCELKQNKNMLPLWIIDEAQNLPHEFFRDLHAFLNFSFDAQSMITVWLMGHPTLKRTLSLAVYEALTSRIQVRVEIKPYQDQASFAKLVDHGLKQVGCQHALMTDSGIERIRQASGGRPRHAGQIIVTAMRLAAMKNLNHLSDDLLQQAIEEQRL